VQPGARILWCGYGNIVAHLTMPWLHPVERYDRERIAYRRNLRLPTAVDERIVELKRQQRVPAYWIVAVNMGPNEPECSALIAYPFLLHHYDLWPLTAIDAFVRGIGLLRPESPRWQLMRRHICSVMQTDPAALSRSGERCIVLTGMPCDPDAIELLQQAGYRQAAFVDPGVPWPEYLEEVMYDAGDAWYVPNFGIHLVSRPGPQVRIFIKEDGEQRTGR
jgi:hypothetical protein